MALASANSKPPQNQDLRKRQNRTRTRLHVPGARSCETGALATRASEAGQGPPGTSAVPRRRYGARPCKDVAPGAQIAPWEPLPDRARGGATKRLSLLPPCKDGDSANAICLGLAPAARILGRRGCLSVLELPTRVPQLNRDPRSCSLSRGLVRWRSCPLAADV